MLSARAPSRLLPRQSDLRLSPCCRLITPEPGLFFSRLLRVPDALEPRHRLSITHMNRVRAPCVPAGAIFWFERRRTMLSERWRLTGVVQRAYTSAQQAIQWFAFDLYVICLVDGRVDEKNLRLQAL